jgi:hypothetical protein
LVAARSTIDNRHVMPCPPRCRGRIVLYGLYCADCTSCNEGMDVLGRGAGAGSAPCYSRHRSTADGRLDRTVVARDTSHDALGKYCGSMYGYMGISLALAALSYMVPPPPFPLQPCHAKPIEIKIWLLSHCNRKSETCRMQPGPVKRRRAAAVTGPLGPEERCFPKATWYPTLPAARLRSDIQCSRVARSLTHSLTHSLTALWWHWERKKPHVTSASQHPLHASRTGSGNLSLSCSIPLRYLFCNVSFHSCAVGRGASSALHCTVQLSLVTSPVRKIALFPGRFIEFSVLQAPYLHHVLLYSGWPSISVFSRLSEGGNLSRIFYSRPP